MADSPSVFISPLGGISEEGGVSEGQWSLPMLVSRVPWEVLEKTCFKNPEERRFFPGSRRVPCDLEGRTGFFLGENSYLPVVRRGQLDGLMRCCFDAASRNEPFVLDYLSRVASGLQDLVYPVEVGGRVLIGYPDPLPWLRLFGIRVRSPGDAFGDVLLALPIVFVVAHSKLCEAFPTSLRVAPQVFDSRTAVVCERVPVPRASETQRCATCV